MAVVEGAASLSGQGQMTSVVGPVEKLASIPQAEPPISLDFSWDPAGPVFSYTLGGTVYVTTTPTTALDTPITFTAEVDIPAPHIKVEEYKWDLGEGSIKYGPEVIHTYEVDNPDTRVLLRVTDSLGRRYYAAHVICLG